MNLDSNEPGPKQLESALLRLVVDTAPDGLIIIDEAGIVRAFSPAAQRLFGYEADEIIGHNVSLLMPSPHAEKHDSYIKRYIETGVRRIIGRGREVCAQKKDGGKIPVELVVGEVLVDNKRLFTGFVRDLTEQRRNEHHIAELQDNLVHVARHSAMGELATTLAHELNQPLTAIANYLLVIRQLVKRNPDCPDNAKALDLLAKTAAQAQRGGETLRSIRTFVRHHENKLSWENLSEAVEEAVKIATLGAKSQNIVVRIKKRDNMPEVRMDRIQIQQVVANLVRNAVDALSGRKGERLINIRIGCTEGGAAFVEVKDNGGGILPEVEKRLFEAFNTSKPEGVGIGLAISKTIIASHRGAIRGHNHKEGGACFSFALPVHPPTKRRKPKQTEE